MTDRIPSFVPSPRHWLLVIAMLCALLGAGLYRGHGMLHEHARQMVEQQLHSVATLRSQEIQRWLNDRLLFLSEPPNGVLANGLAQYQQGQDRAAATRVLDARFRYLHETVPEISSMGLYDLDGNPVRDSHHLQAVEHVRLDEQHQEGARKAIENRRAVLINFHRTATTSGESALDILSPLFAGEGDRQKAVGYILFQIDPAQGLYPILQKWPVPSRTAETLLTRQDGAEITNLTPLRHRAAPPLGLRLPADTPGLIAGMAMRTTDEVLDGIDYRGEPVLGVVHKIPGTDWLLVTKMDNSEIHEDAGITFRWVSGAALALFVILILLLRTLAAALQAQSHEKRYRILAESGSDIVWLYELATQRFAYISPSVEKLLGYTTVEAMQQTMQEMLEPESWHVFNEELHRHLASFSSNDDTGNTWLLELSLPCKDGRQVRTEALMALVPAANGKPAYLQGRSHDITTRRQVEAALIENEEKFRTIYDTINEAIFLHHADDGRIIDVNASACAMYGFSREQLLDIDFGKLCAGIPPYTLDTAREYLQQATEQGWQAFEWMARRSSGQFFWVAVNLKTLRIGGNTQILAVVRDIDGRKHAEEDLKHALAEAHALNNRLAEAHGQLLQSEKMASIGQLAAGVAHEVNNPIGFVSSNINTLDNYLRDIFALIAAYEAIEPAMPAQQRESVHALRKQLDFDYLKTDIGQLMAESKDGLNRVTKIVRDLKDFSRAGDATPHWANLHQGLDSTLNIVWNELKYKCTVKKDYGELPQVWCVPSQINQVFMNLLVNAAHAIDKQGEVTIRTGSQGDEVFVAISDTGTGIAPEHLNRLFEPFFTTKPVGKGTGLGLSLAYSIVKKHRGRFEVQSERGKGSTFTVWLPVNAGETLAPQAVESAGAGGASPA